MNRFLLLSACFLSLAVSAAIITERNDVYLEGRWCLTPPQYTFVGTPSHPGIESCWIPYGTYTDGVGGTEYTRVTSNLMGVVASALEGFAERRNCGWGVYHPDVMMRPATLPEGAVHEGHWRYIDDGSFLSSLTNCSLRIADQLNRPLMYAIPYDYTNVYYYTDAGYDGIELALLKDALGFYGSRRLDALTGNAEPPISSGWSPNLPYNVADSNLWRNVYPKFAFCTNDIYFLPDSSRYSRTRTLPDPNPNGWGSLEGLWGEDFGYALGNLKSALEDMSLAVTIEDVLSYDSGLKYEYPPRLTNDYWTVDGMRLERNFVGGEWDDLANAYVAVWDFQTNGINYAIEADNYGTAWWYFAWDFANSDYVFDYSTEGNPTDTSLDFEGHIATKTELYSDTDDYCHFTNGTTRLDWKRLGIICQLERQMDTTYEASEHEDTLPLWHLDTLHELWYESSPISITFPIPQGDGQEMPPAAGLLRNVSWNNDYDYYSSTTNEYKTIWSTPTCRTPAPQCAGEMYFDGYLGTDIYLEYEDASNIVSKLCSELSQSITGELSHVLFYGDWNPGAGMNLDFNAYYAEGTVIIKHPSNTVEEEVFYSGQLQGDSIPIHWNPESTNAIGYAYSSIHKTTSPTFTFASPETRALTISNFAWKSSALDWSRIYSLRRSELELLLSARDVPSFANDRNPSPGNFTWAEIDDIPHSDRQFRMLQGTAARSLSNADTAQYNLLAGLSAACKTKCEDIGGMPIGAINEVGKLSQDESDAFLDDFKNAKVGATFSIGGSSSEVFQADVHLEGDSYAVDSIYTPRYFPYYVGGCGWNCYVDYQQSVSITNQYRDARVDAHQAPVRKTIWQFKNLRDPNL